MQKAHKELREQTVVPIEGQCLDVREKRIDILPIVDNKKLRKDLIARIEAITLKMIEQISAGRAPCVSHFNSRNVISKSRTREGNVYPGCSTDANFVEEQDANIKSLKNSKKTKVNFAVKQSRDKFVLMAMIMAEIHRLLLINTSRTQRSFYYDLKSEKTTKYLVPRQININRTLNDIANLLECPPWNLRLLATAKGLVAGNMTITLIDNQVIDCSIPGGTQIPQSITNITFIRAKAEFILVIEKDTIFQKLLEENCPSALKCILVTGKGYPDVATRLLVKMLSEKTNLPVYIIVDADPFGVDIMLTYRFGSSTLRRENKNLACPNARWLGIHPSDLIGLGAKTSPLTNADLVKLRSIEARDYVNEAISKQLNILRNGKAEIEAVSSFSKNFLTETYLSYKIDGQDYI